MAPFFFTSFDGCFNSSVNGSIVFSPGFVRRLSVPLQIQIMYETLHVSDTYFPSHFNLLSSSWEEGIDDHI